MAGLTDREEADEYQDVGMVGGRWGRRGSGILYTTGRKVLLLRRSPRVLEPSTWGIPGGAVPETAEGTRMDDLASAMKETREEVGADLGGRLIGTVVFEDAGFTYTTFIMRVSPGSTRTALQVNWESTEWRWVGRAEIRGPGLHLHPGFNASLAEILAKALPVRGRAGAAEARK